LLLVCHLLPLLACRATVGKPVAAGYGRSLTAAIPPLWPKEATVRNVV
jgi:hypothetical protein